MLRSFDTRAEDEVPADAAAVVPAPREDAMMAEALNSLRALIMAGERYRLAVAASFGLGATDSQAISFLVVHGPAGQSELARGLSLTSSAATALVDRLERHGVAERARHPSDRRRTLIRLTDRGERLAVAGQQPLLASLEQVEPRDLPTVSSWMRVIARALHAGTYRPVED